jgi:hypothetical protein
MLRLHSELRKRSGWLSTRPPGIEGGLRLGYTGSAKVGFTQGIGAALSMGDLDAVRGLIDVIDAMKPGVVTPFLRALADRTRARVAALDGGSDVERYFKSAVGLFRETGCRTGGRSPSSSTRNGSWDRGDARMHLPRSPRPVTPLTGSAPSPGSSASIGSRSTSPQQGRACPES